MSLQDFQNDLREVLKKHGFDIQDLKLIHSVDKCPCDFEPKNLVSFCKNCGRLWINIYKIDNKAVIPLVLSN